MHRKHRSTSLHRRAVLLTSTLLVSYLVAPGLVAADLIRSSPSRGYPEVAGDVSGSQTYSFDPVTKTGTFQVVNSPHVLELGPQNRDMIPIQPNLDGTLEQSLKVTLDERGKILDGPGNSFQLRGTVVIGDQTYNGLLLEGRPISFGARTQASTTTSHPTMDAFDLNMRITGGELAKAFGSEAYLRIIPQADSTFRGQFTADFSSGKPLTDLRSNGQGLRLPAPVPEPSTVLIFLAGGLIVLLGKIYRDSAA